MTWNLFLKSIKTCSFLPNMPPTTKSNELKGYLRNQISTTSGALFIDDKVLGCRNHRSVLETGRHRKVLGSGNHRSVLETGRHRKALQAAGIENCTAHTGMDTSHHVHIRRHSGFAVECSSAGILPGQCSALCVHLFLGTRHHELSPRLACCLVHGQLESTGHRTYGKSQRKTFSCIVSHLTRYCSSSPALHRLLLCWWSVQSQSHGFGSCHGPWRLPECHQQPAPRPSCSEFTASSTLPNCWKPSKSVSSVVCQARPLRRESVNQWSPCNSICDVPAAYPMKSFAIAQSTGVRWEALSINGRVSGRMPQQQSVGPSTPDEVKWSKLNNS